VRTERMTTMKFGALAVIEDRLYGTGEEKEDT
jgi:hypothetical protein